MSRFCHAAFVKRSICAFFLRFLSIYFFNSFVSAIITYRGCQITSLTVVSMRFVGHVPQCTKFRFAKIFVGQVKPREGGSNVTPTVKDFWYEGLFRICKFLLEEINFEICAIDERLREFC